MEKNELNDTLLKNDVIHSNEVKVTTNGTVDLKNGETIIEEAEQSENYKGRKCCRHGPAVWCKKYFWEGQHVHSSHQQAMAILQSNAPWYRKFLFRHRRLVAFVLPACLAHFCWWSTMISRNLFHYFKEKYFMSIVMILGSLVAGMTSEGGGAVAFPVMTLAFRIDTSIARDFAMMIQGCGMSCATFSILFMKVKIEWRALLLCALGGAMGLILGFYFVDPNLSAPVKKMAFCSIFFAFASVLAYINIDHKRPTFSKIQNLNWWRILVLLFTGFMGGIFTSFAGNGLDICTFSILTLLFRISEKVATPTSVILMACISVLGVFWRGLVLTDIQQETWEFLAVCMPIVVIGAPVGSVLGSHFHRLVLAVFVIVLDILSLVGAYAVIRPLTPVLIGMSAGIIVFGFVLFGILSKLGKILAERSIKQTQQEMNKTDDQDNNNEDKKENLEDEEEGNSL